MWFCTTKCMVGLWLYKNICTICMARVEEEKDNGTFVSEVRDGIRTRISLLQDLFLLLPKWPLCFSQTSTSLKKYINSVKKYNHAHILPSDSDLMTNVSLPLHAPNVWTSSVCNCMPHRVLSIKAYTQ